MTKKARLDCSPIAEADLRWLRGPVGLSLRQVKFATDFLDRIAGEPLSGWRIERDMSDGEVAFTLDIPDPQDETARIAAALALGDALVAHTRVNPLPLIEWALLPSRRAHPYRTPLHDTSVNPVRSNLAICENRLGLLRAAGSPFFDRIRSGAWPVRSKPAFEAYHFALSAPEREIISLLVGHGNYPPVQLHSMTMDITILDACALSLAAAGWLELGPTSANPGPKHWGGHQTEWWSNYQVTAPGPLLVTRAGYQFALQHSDLLFDR